MSRDAPLPGIQFRQQRLDALVFAPDDLRQHAGSHPLELRYGTLVSSSYPSFWNRTPGRQDREPLRSLPSCLEP